MIPSIERITIIRSKKPIKDDINIEIQWFGSCLGLFSLRDKDSSCYRLFVELLKSSRQNKPLTSDAIAYKLNLSRGTIVHHLNKLMEAGIVVNEKNKYSLRMDSLKDLIEEIEKDAERVFKELKEIAKKIDQELGL